MSPPCFFLLSLTFQLKYTTPPSYKLGRAKQFTADICIKVYFHSVYFTLHLFHSPDLKNPEIVTLRNLTMDSAGVYRCTASNDVGEENCTVEVTMQREFLGGRGVPTWQLSPHTKTASLIDGYCFKLQLEMHFLPFPSFHHTPHSPPALQHWRGCTKMKLVATGHHLFTNSYVSLSRLYVSWEAKDTWGHVWRKLHISELSSSMLVNWILAVWHNYRGHWIILSKRAWNISICDFEMLRMKGLNNMWVTHHFLSPVHRCEGCR